MQKKIQVIKSTYCCPGQLSCCGTLSACDEGMQVSNTAINALSFAGNPVGCMSWYLGNVRTEQEKKAGCTAGSTRAFYESAEVCIPIYPGFIENLEKK